METERRSPRIPSRSTLPEPAAPCSTWEARLRTTGLPRLHDQPDQHPDQASLRSKLHGDEPGWDRDLSGKPPGPDVGGHGQQHSFGGKPADPGHRLLCVAGREHPCRHRPRTRQTISLVSTSSNTVTTSYGGVGTSASWSPDDQAVYITTTTNAVLTHSNFTDWQTSTADEVYSGVSVTVPSVGAYFAGPKFTDGRSYCPASTVTGTGNPPNVDNEFIPLVDRQGRDDRPARGNDGRQAHPWSACGPGWGIYTLTDLDVTLPTNAGCPIPPAAQPAPGYFTSTFTVQPLAGINAASITGVEPASNSTAAFVTYTLPAGATSGGGSIPLYFPPASGSGTVQALTLGNGATAVAAPVAGVFSTDNSPSMSVRVALTAPPPTTMSI